MVRVAVIADDVALRDHLTRNLRQRFNPLPNQEKRGFNVVLFENIQNHGAVWRWAIIKRERNAGNGAAGQLILRREEKIPANPCAACHKNAHINRSENP